MEKSKWRLVHLEEWFWNWNCQISMIKLMIVFLDLITSKTMIEVGSTLNTLEQSLEELPIELVILNLNLMDKFISLNQMRMLITFMEEKLIGIDDLWKLKRLTMELSLHTLVRMEMVVILEKFMLLLDTCLRMELYSILCQLNLMKLKLKVLQ